jgi:hypothetical protein
MKVKEQEIELKFPNSLLIFSYFYQKIQLKKTANNLKQF